jgi:hypothetical protein
MKEVVILSAVRTAIGSFGGSLAEMPPQEMSALVIKESLRRAGVPADIVDEVIMGCILQAGHGQNVTRQALLKAGLPVETPAMTINKLCGSGLRAVLLAAQSIMLDDADVIVAGGMENMSIAPYLIPKGRYGYRMGHGQLVDSMIKDALWCAIGDTHMGYTAENVAARWGITREAQDAFAAASQAIPNETRRPVQIRGRAPGRTTVRSFSAVVAWNISATSVQRTRIACTPSTVLIRSGKNAPIPMMKRIEGIPIPNQAIANGMRFIKEGNCAAVKLEGGKQRASVIAAMVEAEIPVMAHVGLTPQSMHRFGGFKVQGKSTDAAMASLELHLHNSCILLPLL